MTKVLYSNQTGQIGLGIPMVPVSEVEETSVEMKICLVDKDDLCWAVQAAEDEPWIMVRNQQILEADLEVIGGL